MGDQKEEYLFKYSQTSNGRGFEGYWKMRRKVKKWCRRQREDGGTVTGSFWENKKIV